MESLKIISQKVIENDENLISELASELFEPEYYSYKEEYFNELISKYINSKTGVEILPFSTRNYGRKALRFVEQYYRRDGDGENVEMTDDQYIKYLYDVLNVERSILNMIRPRLIALRFAYDRHDVRLGEHNLRFANVPDPFAPAAPNIFAEDGNRFYFTSIPPAGEVAPLYYVDNEDTTNSAGVDFSGLYSSEFANPLVSEAYRIALDEYINPENAVNRLQPGISTISMPIGGEQQFINRESVYKVDDITQPYKQMVNFSDWKNAKKSRIKPRIETRTFFNDCGINFLEREETRILEKIEQIRLTIRQVYTEWHRDQVSQFKDLNNRPGQSVNSWFDWSYTQDDTLKSTGAYVELERISKNTSSAISLPEVEYKNKSYMDSFNSRVFKDSAINKEAENAINLQLDKNSGYFMLENFFYIKDNGENRTYLAELLEKVIPYTTFGTVEGETAGSVTVTQGGLGDMINPDYHYLLSRRMSISDYEILIERLKRTVFALDAQGISADYKGKPLRELPSRLTIKGETFKNPVNWVRSNTVFGLRLVYVAGYGDPTYENQLYENNLLKPEQYKFLYPINPNKISERVGTIPFAKLNTDDDVYSNNVVNRFNADNLYGVEEFQDAVFKHEGSSVYMNDGYRFRQYQSQTKTGRAFLNKHVTSDESLNNSGIIHGDNAFETFTFEVATVTKDVKSYVDHCGNTIAPSDFFDTEEGPLTNPHAGKAIAASMKDTMLRDLLGVIRDDQGVYRIDNEIDPNDNIKLLFDDIFPLDRLSSLYFINEEGFFDKSTNFRDFLAATRATTRRVYRVLLNKSSVNVGDEEQLDGPSMYGLINSAMGSMGPDNRENSMVNEFLEDIVPQLIKMVLMAVPTMIRGLAVGFDPGFGSMKKTFEQDPCKLQGGMSWGSIKGPPYVFPKAHPLAGIAGVPTKQLDDGFDNSNPCAKNFAPMTFGAPVDIGLGAGWLVVEIVKMILGAGNPVPPALTLANSVQHLVNAVKGKDTMSYGSFLGPVGMIGLSMPQLPGEEPSKRHEEANCEEKECGEPGDGLEVVPDPCDELEEEQ